MNAQEMWALFSQRDKIEASYDAWSFGDAADKLAELVLNGIKTATSSAHPLYEIEGEPLPEVGQYSVILDSEENAICVILTEAVYVMPFNQVNERQAWKEGEGDRSLEYWRSVHRHFFKECMVEAGLCFQDTMNVVCEEFIRVYP